MLRNARLHPRLAPWVVSLATFLLMLATEPRLSIVWDEGYTLGREARLRLWFSALVDPLKFAESWTPPTEELVQQEGLSPPRREQIDTRGKLLLDPQVLGWCWPFAREEPHGHPPFYALIGLIGDLATPWRADLGRARLGPMLVFSLIAGTLFGFIRTRYGTSAALVASSAWVLQPNLFAHGHYATYDALLSALWLGALLAFWRGVEEKPGEASAPIRWGWAVVFGLLFGFALDTKLTGWFLPFPLMAWISIYQSRRGLLTLLFGSALALVVMYALNPPWWAEPVYGPFRFFASNLGRSDTIPIKILFLGEVISTPDGSLPWYNTLVWTVFVTPVGFLSLAFVGIGRALRRWKSEPFGLLALGNWAFFLLLRALPHTPGHDGVRQFLPAFGMLAVVAGLGGASVAERLGRWGKIWIGLAIAEGVLGLALIFPVPLSYYSPIVGGLPGATRLGMEPTFYWDSLDAETLEWLKAHTQEGQKVRFATFPTSWLYLRRTGELPQGLHPRDPGVWTWYVLQNRPGSFSALDRALIAQGKPARVVEKWGVPLLWIYPFEQVEALLRSSPPPPQTNHAPSTKTSTTSRVSKEVVDMFQRPVSLGCRCSLAGGENLGSGVRLGSGGRVRLARGVDRGVARSRAAGRGGLADRGRLVAEADLGELEVAVQLGELGKAEVALLDRSGAGDGSGFANRNGLTNRSRSTSGLAALLQLKTRRSVAGGQEEGENSGGREGQNVASH